MINITNSCGENALLFSYHSGFCDQRPFECFKLLIDYGQKNLDLNFYEFHILHVICVHGVDKYLNYLINKK